MSTAIGKAKAGRTPVSLVVYDWLALLQSAGWAAWRRLSRVT